ncbi:MAG TPA: AAA family ATPase [Candidatus Limnocylindrales bacterium]|nr:AAA family ATPase [Candidatus Limnocylindrales bacterium]
MSCPNCGAATVPGQRFCASCGTRLDRACANCQTPLPDGARFCPSCGTPVDESATPGQHAGTAGAAPAAGAPATAADPAVERRRVSVLFVDLVGYTDLATRLDPEETRDFQGAYFARAREIVERYGGVVEKFVGDAVMAVWGAPTSNEDDAERAVRAGLDLVAAVPQLAAPGRGAAAAGSQRPTALSARAGIATGEAAVTIGAEGQGLVSGETVNLAARLQAAAEPDTLLADEATRHAAAAAIAFESAGDRALKGFSEPVAVWRAARVVAGRGGQGRSDELEAPFVGRDAELALVKELFHATARERRLRVVSITGQAGIGKSRLVWEFEKYIDGITDDVYWHQGRSPAYGEGITFWALGEMVRRRAGIVEGEDDATTAANLREMLATHVPEEAERARLAPALGILLGLEGPAPTERGELFGAWRTLFERLAEQAPVVLVFEDLQWADSGLVDFLGHLLEWSRQQPIFVITLARPELVERFPTWGAGQRNFTSMHLEPLPDDSMRALLAGLVPGLPPKTVKAILARAEGVPLYAVETVRMLLADGRVVREGDAYRVAGPVDELSIPATLHSLVAARLDTLTPADRSVLQQASVLGLTFSVDGLAAVADQTAEALAPVLDRLAARELVRLETDPRSPERGQYTFVQAVIREVAYQTLTRKDRRERHLAAARYFESLGDEALAGALARHYLDAWRAAGEGPEADALAAQARVALKGAADRAVALHAYDQAAAFLKQALDVAADDAERAGLLERAGDASRYAARMEEAEATYQEAIESYRRLGDLVGEGRAVERQGRLLVDLGRLDEGIALTAPVTERLAHHEGGEAELLRLRALLARGHFLRQENELAIELADQAIADAERMDIIEPLVDALITKGSALAPTRLREAQAILFGAVRLADLHGLVGASLRGRNNLGVYMGPEDPRVAYDVAVEALAIGRRLGVRDGVMWHATQVVFNLLERGETDEVHRLVAEFMDDDVTGVIRLFMLGGRLWLDIIEGRTGGRAEALAEMEALAGSISNQEYASSRLFTRAGTHEWAGDFASAARDLKAALEGRPDDTGGLCWYGRAAARAGLMAEARAAYEQAMAAAARGKRIDAERLQLAACLAAVTGDPSASRMYADVAARLREMELLLSATMAQIEWAELVGLDDPLARIAAEEARRTALAKGWHGVQARLDALFAKAALPADGPAAPGPDSTPTVGSGEADAVPAGGGH